jgi:mono/diheme cytochrome c family protein
MPKFPHLSDEDISDIVAYLRSDRPEVQPSDKIQPKAKPSFLGKALTKLVFRPLPYEGEPITAPPVTDKVAYGAYIANSKLDCFSCHSEDFKTQNILEPQKTPGFYGGGNRFEDYEEVIFSANITPDVETGIGSWTEENFTNVLKFGVKPDGTPVRAPMVPYPLLSDDDISAIWAYLQTIPTLKNDVKAMYNTAKAEN